METTFERSYLGSAGLVTDVEESREFEWDDDIDLNRIDAGKEVYEKYFEKECSRCTLSLVANNNLESMYVPRYCSDCGRKL